MLSRTRRSIQNSALCRRILVIALVGLAVSACRTTGDFGRVKPSYYYDTVLPTVRHHVSKHVGTYHSSYPLSEDEQELRARSFSIVDNGAPPLVLDQGDYQRERRVRHAAGSADLDEDPYPREPSVLLQAIDEDLKLIRPFERVATTVYKTDKQRLRDLRQGGDVPADYVLSTTARVDENRGVVDRTILTLHNRIDDYEIEMRRSLLKFPGPYKGDLMNAIGRLSQRVRRLEMRMRGLSDPKGANHFSDLMG